MSAAKILVVDDVEINRTVYAECLRRLPDVQVIEASNGNDALELSRQHDFAMYLLDVVMPGMDGFELASLLREDPRSQTVPILFVTGHSPDEALVTRGYRMGGVDFMVTKPVAPEVLQQKARVFLRLYNKRKELGDLVEQVQQENTALHAKLQEFLREQDALRRMATHDPLTGLPNRVLFRDRFEQAISRARRAKQMCALAYLDLDGFKRLNDEHGHGSGDALLVEVAARLRRMVRESDTLARLGGDEFALLLEGLDSVAAAEYVLADKIRPAIMARVDVRSGSTGASVAVQLGVSVGIAAFPIHGEAADQLIARADTAMYEAKRAGGGIRVFPLGAEKPAGRRRRTGERGRR